MKDLQKKILWGLLAVLLFLFCASFILFSYGQRSLEEGINSVLNKSQRVFCSDESARFVIETKRLQPVRECDVARYTVGEEKINVVSIWYGEAQDCMAGCFFESFYGAVSVAQKEVMDIPLYDKKHPYPFAGWSQERLPGYPKSQSHPATIQCDQDLKALTRVELARMEGQLGWKIVFAKPYTCTWEETKMQKFHDNYYDSTVTMDKVTRSWEGSVFYAVHNNQEIWDTDGMTSQEVSREEYTYEESQNGARRSNGL